MRKQFFGDVFRVFLLRSKPYMEFSASLGVYLFTLVFRIAVRPPCLVSGDRLGPVLIESVQRLICDSAKSVILIPHRGGFGLASSRENCMQARWPIGA